MTPGDAILVGAMAFFASIVGGLAGYGTNLLMPLVLVPIVGAEATVPILAVSGLVNNATRLAVFRDRVDWPRVAPLIAVALPFCFVGAGAYSLLSGRQASMVIGVMLLVLVPGRYLLKRWPLPASRPVTLGAGALYGLLTGGTPGAGIVLVALLVSMGLAGPAVIATDSAVSLVVGIAKVATFQALGDLPPSSWVLALVVGGIGVPGVMVARWLGERMSMTLHGAILDTAILAGGAFLVMRGAGWT
ncbi:MAG: sulfite exporter TauE/SafE family protein [Alphaproteobacteria bacterium]|nr:sulfite exporter TauE/SafE family protein [Alphaproteobacteria bacterium]